jgi:hypothetical protein
MRQLGGAFGVAVIAAVFTGTGTYASASSFVDGFGPALGSSACLAFAGACAGLTLPRRRRQSRPSAAVARAGG